MNFALTGFILIATIVYMIFSIFGYLTYTHLPQ